MSNPSLRFEKDYFTIGEMAAVLQVSAETLRAWERQGKIPAPPRSRGGLRFYPKDAYVPYFQARGYKMPGIQLVNAPTPFRLLPLGTIDCSLFNEETDGHLILGVAIHKAVESVLTHFNCFMDKRGVWHRTTGDKEEVDTTYNLAGPRKTRAVPKRRVDASKNQA